MWPNPVSTISGAVSRRGPEMPDDSMAQLPGWAVIVIFADFLVFFPLFVYIVYTLSHV